MDNVMSFVSSFKDLKLLHNALIIFTTVSIIIVTNHLVSLYAFTKRVKSGGGLPPTVPHAIPLIAHTPTFASGGDAIGQTLLAKARTDTPIRFKGIGFDFVYISGTHLIRKALVSSSHLDWNILSAKMFGAIFAGPKGICEATLADDSGIGAKPYPGTSVPPGRRILRNQVIFFSDAFSKKSLDELIPRFKINLGKEMAKLDIGSEWKEMDDLLFFLRSLAFPAAVKSFMGESLFSLNPTFAEDYRVFDDNIPFFSMGLPPWLKPRAARARAKCLDAVKKWRQQATRNSEMKLEAYGSEWDPAWGLAAIRRRNKLYEATEGLFGEDAMASVDIATLFSFTSNVIPFTFWFIYEILNPDNNLLARSKAEIDTSKAPDGSIDPAKLVNRPTLQAIYAEVLRLHSSSLITRNAKQTHAIGSWIIPKDQQIMVSSHVEHRSTHWNVIEPSSNTEIPPSSFNIERFLVPDEKGGTQFSVEGKQGIWMPYGMGEHMCPGRHFAKNQMMLSFAILMEKFDIELLGPRGWKPDDDYKRYGLGALGPKQSVKFRIRRHADK